MSDRSFKAGGNVDRSVVITGDGNHATINLGGQIKLPLARKQVARPPRKKETSGAAPNRLKILLPDAGLLPLVGRKDVLQKLGDWLDDDADVSVQTLTGQAGTGKTRLAVELCKSVDGTAATGEQGWAAGFIRPSDFETVADALATQSFDWTRPTLLVIDYAAAVHRPLARWLDRLAGETFAGKLRLLLLEREAPHGFGWWNDLTRDVGQTSAPRTDLFVDPDRPYALPGLDQGKVRHELLAAAHRAVRDLAGDDDGYDLPDRGEEERLDQQLDEPRFGNPLNLAMCGMIAAERGWVEACALRRLDAAHALADHEVRRLDSIAAGDDIAQSMIRHAIGFNGLAGGLPVKGLRKILIDELTTAGQGAPPPALAQLLQQELPPASLSHDGSEPRLNTVQPDLIGEAVIIRTLLEGDPASLMQAPEIAKRAYAIGSRHAADALMRLIQDYGPALEDAGASEAAQAVAERAFGLLTAVAESIPDEDVFSLERLVEALPEQSVVLREQATVLTQRLAMIWVELAESNDSEDFRARVAAWKGNLANRLSDLGRYDAALTASQDTEKQFRALASVRPDAFTPDWALSLNNLASRQIVLGQHAAALVAAKKSVALRSKLAAAQPDAFNSYLALSLNNLAIALSGVDQPKVALKTARKAVKLGRGLATKRTDASSAALATSLDIFSNRLSDLGRDKAALKASQEVVGIYQSLAAARPDAFTPDLAGSLNNLANRLKAVGQFNAALSIAQKAVALRRGLAATRPDAFTPALAMSLSVLGDMLEAMGRLSEAVAADHECLSKFEPYFLARPAAHARITIVYVRDYLRRTKGADIPEDEDLLLPILEALKPYLQEDPE